MATAQGGYPRTDQGSAYRYITREVVASGHFANIGVTNA